MSLLLEALKKAEKAKEEAQRRAEADAGPAAAPAEEAPAPAPDTRRVMTRDELPDISQPVDIQSEDMAPAPRARAASPVRELALQEDAPPPQSPAAAPPRARPAADAQTAARATAQKVFEAKFREPNPKLPFYITMGVLGVFALGTVIYFWYQLRPPPSLVNTNPQRSASEKPVEAAPTQPGASAPASVSSSPSLPGLPAQGPAAAPRAESGAPRAEPRGEPRIDSQGPRLASPRPTKPIAALPAVAAADAPERTARPAPQVMPQLDTAFAAYQRGDLAAARSAYEQAVAAEPANRDALLGLAAVHMRSGDAAAADLIYQRLLKADPRDPHAHAGMLALRNASVDPLAAESRLKSLLAADPASAVLQFALGNLYAQQARWAEAQQAYFRAATAEPENPDFAYNLAVSLDHLRQPRPALEHYRRAVALAEKRGAAFSVAAARERVQQLER